MRFTEYLKDEQLYEAPLGQDTVGWDARKGQAFAGARPANRFAGAEQPKQKAKPAMKSAAPNPLAKFIQIASKDRTEAMEMITLLGSMYQTRRRNPGVKMTVPKMVTQSRNRQAMEDLFNIAKDKDLPQLASMSQEIKRSAAAPAQAGAAPNPAGMQNNVPQTPGQTSAQKTTLQKLFTYIKKVSKHLSPADFQAAKKELDKAAQIAKPNPPANPQQPINTGNKSVVTTG